MKKLSRISVLLAIALLFICSISAFAEVVPYGIGSSSGSSSLSISSGTATCTSTYIGQGSTVEITITQTLEKQGFLWIWSTYAGEWTKTVTGKSASLTNRVYNLESGTYRVKTEVEVVENGKTNSYITYSANKTVG